MLPEADTYRVEVLPALWLHVTPQSCDSEAAAAGLVAPGKAIQGSTIRAHDWIVSIVIAGERHVLEGCNGLQPLRTHQIQGFHHDRAPPAATYLLSNGCQV